MLTRIEAVAAIIERELAAFADVAVVGISGGVDSAVVASASVAALGKENVHLVSMPYDETDDSTFNLRSRELASKLGAHHYVIPIASATDAAVREITDALRGVPSGQTTLHRLTHGNTRARLRMTTLYGIAGELSFRFEEEEKHKKLDPIRGQYFSKRVRVIGTGNASEDLIGYDTKGGDALADLFIIGDLFKSEVYQLAKHYEVPQSILEAPPSAGLYPGQTDADELGHSYEDLEPALSALHRALSRGVADELLSPALDDFQGVDPALSAFVIARFVANAHKHRAPKVVPLRHIPFVKDIWRDR
ncbi:MAG: NAD(+) synthase [Bdellovibrionales bacterium]|nr:NAD(+) synthase [Bdellovibrionales bacterium]